MAIFHKDAKNIFRTNNCFIDSKLKFLGKDQQIVKSIIKDKITVNFQNKGKQVIDLNVIILEKVNNL